MAGRTWNIALPMALLALVGEAPAGIGDLTPVHSVSGALEAVGDINSQFSIVHVRMTDVGAAPSAFDPVYQIQFYGSDGSPIGPLIDIAPTDVAEVLGNGDFDINDDEIWQVDLSEALELAPHAWSCDVLFHEANGDVDQLTFHADGFPGLDDDSDSIDTLFEISRTRPRLVQALTQVNTMTPANSMLLLGFAIDPLGPASNLPNSLRFPNTGIVANSFDTPQTGFPANSGANAALSANDFELADDSEFVTNLSQFTTLLSGGALFNGQQYLMVRYNSSGPLGDLNGQFIRIDEPTSVVRDGVGHLATGAVQVQPFAEFAAIEAEWIATVSAGEQDVEALRIRFNHPLNSVIVGDTTFFDGLKLGGGATDLAVDGPIRRDPNDSFAVLIRIDAPGLDSVDTEGLGPGAAMYSIDLDAMFGMPAQDVYGAAYPAASAITLSIGDGIESTGCDPIPGDTNNDGVVNITDLNQVLGNFGTACQ